MSAPIDFELRAGDFIPLDKLLKATGTCGSGGEARAAVSRGEVRVDGTVETRKRAKIKVGQIVVIGTTEIRVRRPDP